MMSIFFVTELTSALDLFAKEDVFAVLMKGYGKQLTPFNFTAIVTPLEPEMKEDQILILDRCQQDKVLYL